jgi:hypothetical protein
MRDASGTPTLVDGPKTLSSDVTVTASHTTLRYDFEGTAQAAYQVVVTGSERVWQLDVVPITGAVSVTPAS